MLPSQRTKPRVEGPQIAMVVGPKGEEIYTDKYGRIRLQFLWDRYGQHDDHSSCWIRVTQPWAGKGWGMIAIPRVGQEVLVDFLDGDPDQPIVTGRTYHANNMPPGVLPGAKTQMNLMSQTYKGSGYNGILMEDATNGQKLDLHAQRDMNTTVLNNRSTNVYVCHSEGICKSQSIIISGNRHKTVIGNELNSILGTQSTRIELKAEQKTTKSITVSSTGESLSLVAGNSSIVLTKEGQLIISGSGTVKVNGKKVCLNNAKVL